MKDTTVHQLNQINAQFYDQVVKDFVAKRSRFWAGWEHTWSAIKRVPHTSPSPPVFLDIGCGHGRWATFVAEQMGTEPFIYIGVDANKTLLNTAKHTHAHRTNFPHQQITFHQLDVITTLLEHQLASELQQILGQHRPHCVSLFGVLHHVPSQHLRQLLCGTLISLLEPGGVLALTAWQFSQNPALMKRAQSPQTLGLDPVNLETGDYLLTWEQGRGEETHTAVRYCHETTASELSIMMSPQPVRLLTTFTADGKSNQENLYQLWTKN